MPEENQAILNFETALAQLGDGNFVLSSRIVSALTGASKTKLASFARAWTTISVERRRHAAQMMVQLAEDNFELDFELLFRYLLNDEDPEVRVAGIGGLWESEDAGLIKPMIGFLRSDANAIVRAAAADLLGRFILLGEYGRLGESYTQMIGEALLATIRSGDEDLIVRCRALESLAYWSDDIVRTVIEAAYEDSAREMRASSVAAMGRTADAYWRQTAQDELESPDPRMRFEAVRATGELENREAAPRLIELVDDPDREVQMAAITALGQVGGKVAKQALTEAAHSEDEVLSALATEALEELNFGAGSEFLLFDLSDSDEGEINTEEES